jgi:hypothetical protein
LGDEALYVHRTDGKLRAGIVCSLDLFLDLRVFGRSYGNYNEAPLRVEAADPRMMDQILAYLDKHVGPPDD